MKTKTNLFQALVLVAVSCVFSVPCYSQQANPTLIDPEVSYNPKPASASLYNLGLKSYENGDLESAVTFFKRAIDLDADFVDAYFNLGAIYKKQRKYALAINAFQRAVETNQNDYEAIYELGSCHLAMKNYAFASKYFNVIPPNFPKYAEAKANLSKINSIAAIASGNPVIVGDIASPENQARLLVNTLNPDKPQQESEGDYEKEQELSVKEKSEILVNTLTKPFVTTFDKEQNSFNTISSSFVGPTGIAKDIEGNIYIANFSVDSIERISPDGTKEIFVDKVGIQGPVGLAFDSEDNLYVANYRGGSVVKISPDRTVSVVLDELNKPYYLLYDRQSNKLLVTEQGKNSLLELDLNNVSNRPLTRN